MAHEFERGVSTMACGILTLLRSRIADHRREHMNRKPMYFVMHAASIAELEAVYRQHGSGEPLPRGDFLEEVGPRVFVRRRDVSMFDGVPIALCPCGQALAIDIMRTCTAAWEDL